MLTTSNLPTQIITKGCYYGNSVGNVNRKAFTDHHTSPLNNDSSNATSADAITTTTDDPTPSTNAKVGHYVNGGEKINKGVSNDAPYILIKQ